MVMQLPFVVQPPPPPGGGAPPKNEGALKDAKTLAIFLAWANVFGTPSSREEMVEHWETKRDSVQYGYLVRAERLLQAWNGTKPKVSQAACHPWRGARCELPPDDE